MVAVRQGSLLGTAFHPELTEDLRFHQYFASIVEDSAAKMMPTVRHLHPSDLPRQMLPGAPLRL